MSVASHPSGGRRTRDNTINRQLHDLVVPQLFVLSTGLAALKRREGEYGTDSALVSDLAEVAAQVLADLRSISRGQGVHEGGELGRVGSRLRVALETVGRLTGCEVDLAVMGHASIDASLEDDVVAVTWESMANAIRHGRATRLLVELSAENATLSIKVTDNGNWQAVDDEASSGIAGLQNRAAAWGGRAVVEHSQGSTRVIWRVPLDAKGRSLTSG